jgi:exonuclease-1
LGWVIRSRKYQPNPQSSKRDMNLALGKDLLKTGSKMAAVDAFQKCVDVTPQMASKVIKRLQRMKINYIVAPYEADAQLRYLDLTKQVFSHILGLKQSSKLAKVDGIITEDSDLLAYGCRKVIYKLDKSGAGIEIDTDRLGEMTEFQDWRMDTFRQLCILAGCDYLANIKGIGLKTAHKLMKRMNSWRMVNTLTKPRIELIHANRSFCMPRDRLNSLYPIILRIFSELKRLFCINESTILRKNV